MADSIPAFVVVLRKRSWPLHCLLLMQSSSGPFVRIELRRKEHRPAGDRRMAVTKELFPPAYSAAQIAQAFRSKGWAVAVEPVLGLDTAHVEQVADRLVKATGQTEVMWPQATCFSIINHLLLAGGVVRSALQLYSLVLQAH